MDSNTFVITLPQLFHLDSIEELYSSLPKQPPSTVVIDGSDVSKVDSAGIQLLLSLQKELNQASGKLQWKAVSEPLDYAIKTFGLSTELAIENQH